MLDTELVFAQRAEAMEVDDGQCLKDDSRGIVNEDEEEQRRTSMRLKSACLGSGPTSSLRSRAASAPGRADRSDLGDHLERYDAPYYGSSSSTTLVCSASIVRSR